MNEVTRNTIKEWRMEALKKGQEIKVVKKGRDVEKETAFLCKLRDSADLFTDQLVRRALAELRDSATKGYLRKKFFFQSFKEKYGPVKISTLVKGFHIEGEWDASIFEKIGIQGTPFQRAVRLLSEKGILLEDVSDITKGAGFWLEVKFAENE